MRWLAAIDIDLASLEGKWGDPEIVCDALAEWLCFAFSLDEGGAFFLQRETENPPTPLFILSVTRDLFFAESAARIVDALGIPETRIVHLSDEFVP
ncbi:MULTISPECIES: hypothetical protein [unclassified Streptomyces]|uniref:hypothetical protein n=1 Tax=unclassified Streptomyces TaxID=2593676 RepID=UPI003D719D84